MLHNVYFFLINYYLKWVLTIICLYSNAPVNINLWLLKNLISIKLRKPREIHYSFCSTKFFFLWGEGVLDFVPIIIQNTFLDFQCSYERVLSWSLVQDSYPRNDIFVIFWFVFTYMYTHIIAAAVGMNYYIY